MTEVNNTESRKRGGRPKGSRNKRTLLAERMFQDEADEIIRACIEGAKKREPVALKLAIERLVPVRRGLPIKFRLPDVASLADANKALAAILKATSRGELNVDECSALCRAISVKLESTAIAELEARLKSIEERLSRPNHLRAV
jgi:hypothetical protein